MPLEQQCAPKHKSGMAAKPLYFSHHILYPIVYEVPLGALHFQCSFLTFSSFRTVLVHSALNCKQHWLLFNVLSFTNNLFAKRNLPTYSRCCRCIALLFFQCFTSMKLVWRAGEYISNNCMRRSPENSAGNSKQLIKTTSRRQELYILVDAPLLCKRCGVQWATKMTQGWIYPDPAETAPQIGRAEFPTPHAAHSALINFSL